MEMSHRQEQDSLEDEPGEIQEDHMIWEPCLREEDETVGI